MMNSEKNIKNYYEIEINATTKRGDFVQIKYAEKILGQYVLDICKYSINEKLTLIPTYWKQENE